MTYHPEPAATDLFDLRFGVGIEATLVGCLGGGI